MWSRQTPIRPLYFEFNSDSLANPLGFWRSLCQSGKAFDLRYIFYFLFKKIIIYIYIYIYIFTSSLFQPNAPGPLPWTKPYGLPLGRCVTQCEACGPTNVRWRLLSADFGYAPCFFFFININYWPLTYSLVISPFQVFNWDGYYLVWKRLK